MHSSKETLHPRVRDPIASTSDNELATLSGRPEMPSRIGESPNEERPQFRPSSDSVSDVLGGQPKAGNSRLRNILTWIAALFLSASGGLLVVRLPSWREQRHEEKASRIISDLTPDSAIERCGQPIQEAFEILPTVDTEPVPARRLYYRGKVSNTVLLTFVGSMEQQPTRKLASFEAVIGTRDKSGYLALQKNQAKIEDLPCLAVE